MPDRTSLTTAEVDAILTATAHSKLMKKKRKAIHVGNVRTPTLELLLRHGRVNASPAPTRGEYVCHMYTPRDEDLVGFSGRDVLSFVGKEGLFDVKFSTGDVHDGDEWVHQQIREAGIAIDYDKAFQTQIDISKQGWWTKGAETRDQMVNLAVEKLEAMEENWVQKLNLDFWRSNASDGKKWPGMDSLFSATTNLTGTVGNRDRASTRWLRHQLMTGVNKADIELSLNQLVRKCKKRCGDQGYRYHAVCGENVYDAIIEQMFSGSTSVTNPRFDRRWAEEKAAEMGAKLNIGLPDDAIYIKGVGLLHVEPCFEDLDDLDGPAVAWQDRLYITNLKHVSFKPTQGYDGITIVHQTPHNQRVTHISKEGEYALMADQMDCHGVLVISGS